MPSGDWVRLFQQDSNHLRTELIRVHGTSHRYLTLDFWKSEAAYDRFRQQHLAEYRKCEEITEREGKFGDVGTNGLRPRSYFKAARSWRCGS